MLLPPVVTLPPLLSMMTSRNEVDPPVVLQPLSVWMESPANLMYAFVADQPAENATCVVL
jgi:hypothetical protein